MKQKWQDAGREALVSPAYPSCAFKAENADNAGFTIYSCIWNIVNYPTGCVPVTVVLPEEENGYTDTFNDLITKTIKKDMKGSAGLPIGV
jgi:hypothetical protein